jgi:hypothetical protein
MLLNFFPGTARADCCSYGCCDCGCIALKAQKNASYIANSMQKKLGRGGSVKSFSIDVGNAQNGRAKWVCTAAPNGANCSRQ